MLKNHQILDQVSTGSTLRCCVTDQTNLHVHLEKRVFWHVFVPSSGLDENNIKGALAPLYGKTF